MALIEGCKHELSITIPVDLVDAERQRVIADVSKEVRLPGFRPGKAPVAIVKTRFASDIQQKTLEALIPKALEARFKQDHLEVVSRPDIKDLKFEEGQPLEFKAEFEVAPVFELGEYVGLEVPYAEPSVSDEDLAARLDAVREQKAQFVNQDPRPLANGDYAAVELESVSGLAEPVKNDDMLFRVGDAENLPEFNQALDGMSPDEEKEFDVTYPADYGQEKLAGHTVRFRMKLKQVRLKELPEVSDDLAKELGDFQNVEELKGAVRSTLHRERENEAQSKAKTALIDKLVEAHEFAVPETFIDRQIQVIAENYVRSLAMQGADLKNMKLDWEKLKETRKDQATKDVRASLILEKVADRESIHTTKDEIDKEIQRIARHEREAPASVRQRLEKDGTLGRIAGQIRTNKVLNFLFDKARKTAA